MSKVVCESKRLVVLARDDWEYVERKKGKSAVGVVAVTAGGELVLTEQFRVPVDARVLDLPAGLVGDEEANDDPAATAKKELEEETGYVCEDVELLATGPTSPGITSERVSLYRARGVRKTGNGGGVGGEKIDVHLVRVEDAGAWLAGKSREGVLIDPKIWAALYFLATNP